MSSASARFDALRNAFYHSSRKAFYDFWNRFLSFVIIVAGAAAVSDLSSTLGLAKTDNSSCCCHYIGGAPIGFRSGREVSQARLALANDEQTTRDPGANNVSAGTNL
jgi:hypothetical protein